MKKFLLLTLCVLFTLPSFSREIAYEWKGQTLIYTVLDETARTVEVGPIVYDMNISGDVEIPKEISDGGIIYKVNSIGNNAFQGIDITSISIPESVNSIGEFAFDNCHRLTSISIPNSVKSIGNYAFEYCDKLVSISIPEGVTSIGECAFQLCTKLSNINLPNTLTFIGRQAFFYSGLTSITIPPGVTSLEDVTFYGCSKLSSINIPNSVTSIGTGTFYKCGNLQTITIPESVTSIGIYAFYECKCLKDISLPKNLTSIEDETFFECSSLTSIVIPDGVKSIGKLAFGYCENLTSVIIPESVKEISDDAFEGCTSITYITLPDFLTCADGTLVYSLNGLTKTAQIIDCENAPEIIDIPKEISYGGYNYKVNSIGDGAFKNKDNIKSIIIPEGIISIGSEAFNNCTGLSTISIPKSVTSIGAKAFNGCSGLTEIFIPKNVSTIGSEAFSQCSNLVKAEFASLESLCKISFADKYANPLAITKKLYVAGKEIKDIVIPNGVTTIKRFSFSNMVIRNLKIPESVKSIVNDAFKDCTVVKAEFESIKSVCNISFGNEYSNPVYQTKHMYINGKELKEIEIPGEVKSIGNYAFNTCLGITSVTIQDGVKSIGDYAFNNCADMKYIQIPESVTSIGDYAFRECIALKSVKIPSNITKIGFEAFSYCFELKSIIYPANQLLEVYTRIFDDNRYVLTKLYLTKSGLKMRENVVPWKNFKSVAEWDPFNDVVNTDTDGNKLPITFTFSGINYEITSGNEVAVTCVPNASFITNKGYVGDINIPDVVEYYGKKYLVTSIGKDAFKKNYDLVSVKIPDSVTQIEKSAFNSSSLQSIEIPNSVVSIDDYAFAYCGNLKTVTIPESVKRIGVEAFNCRIKNIVVEALTPPVAYYNTFRKDSYQDATLTIPEESESLYRVAECWKEFFINKAGVETTSSSDLTEIGRYNIEGQKVENNYHGMVVVRYSDGSSKKIFVK